MELMRINKYLAQKGIASRREVDKLIEEGKIFINGKKATPGEKVSDRDKIEISGKRIDSSIEEKKVYFLLNKPKKIISATKDDRGRKTVVDLIKCNERIFPIGRLDYDTEGAILLTNDGEIYNKVIHPKSEIYKEYVALIKGEISDIDIQKLRRGIKLKDGMTLPAKVKLMNRENGKSEVSIAIREGRNRQVRRMFQKLGYFVLELRREKIGDIILKDLKVGNYRELTKKELEYLKSL